MRRSQYRTLSERYLIIMWDLVTRDYNPKLTGEQVLDKVKHYVRPGSIITFHDSLRAVDNLYYALPRAIEWLQSQDYEIKVFD
jgi:peptidoglycan/xylan/chitin deacetylase (PgdA/CDA1 family)